MENIFPQVKKNFGFGCMRLPTDGIKINYERFSSMIDTFIENGFNYFDTAHGYHFGKSEVAIRECLVKRYPRESFVLANKLSEGFFRKEDDIVPFFEKQLGLCAVDYFDFYLMHALNARNYKKYQKCNAFEICSDLKKQGKIKHLGMSFHDKAQVLDEILTQHPEIEFVQIQFNYYDYENKKVESLKCYDVCRKHNKPVIVMEPVRGGKLVKLPKDARAVFDSLGDASYASYAIRFAASFDGVFMVLSGMGSMEMMNDNVSYMKDFKPLSEKEYDAVAKVRAILRKLDVIDCTACRYCIEGCPKNIPIADLFSCYNAKKQFGVEGVEERYSSYTKDAGRASDCIECGKCEAICPQQLQIKSLLKILALEFE